MSGELWRQSYFVFCLLIGGRVGWILLPGLEALAPSGRVGYCLEGRLLFDRKRSCR